MDGNHDRNEQRRGQDTQGQQQRPRSQESFGHGPNEDDRQPREWRERDGTQGHEGNGQRRGNGAQTQNFAEIALRGTALLVDLQLEAARNLWQTQARTAAMLGMPDFSNLFHVGDDRARRVFSTGTEQLVNTLRHTVDTMSAMQRELARLAERQTIGITDQMRRQAEQLGNQTERGLDEIGRMTVRQADDLAQRAEQARGQRQQGEQSRDRAMDEAGRGVEQLGHGVEQGGRNVEQGGAAMAARGSQGHEGGEAHDRGNDQRPRQRHEEANDERHAKSRAKA